MKRRRPMPHFVGGHLGEARRPERDRRAAYRDVDGAREASFCRHGCSRPGLLCCVGLSRAHLRHNAPHLGVMAGYAGCLGDLDANLIVGQRPQKRLDGGGEHRPVLFHVGELARAAAELQVLARVLLFAVLAGPLDAQGARRAPATPLGRWVRADERRVALGLPRRRLPQRAVGVVAAIVAVHPRRRDHRPA